VLGALCLADEPNASMDAVDEVIGIFMGVVNDEDGSSFAGTVVHAAAIDLSMTQWASRFRDGLAREFFRRDSLSRTSVGGLLGAVVWWPAFHDPTSMSGWLSQQIERLQSGDELEAVEAALGIQAANLFQATTVIPVCIDALIDRLSGSAAMTHAAAWALGRMNSPLNRDGRWRASAEQTRRMVAFIANRTADPEAVRFASWVVGVEKAAEAREPLLAWLGADSLELRIAVVEALGKIGGESVVQPLILRLEDLDAEVQIAAAEALGKIGNQAAVMTLMRRLKDPEERVRCAALGGLAQRSQQDAILLSLNLDGFAPFLDPHLPITEGSISDAAHHLQLTQEAIRALYEALAAEFHLQLAWRPRAT